MRTLNLQDKPNIAFMLLDILKGFIIGICASAPVGPIAILVVQKSLSKGQKAGFVAGMGACVVDTIFSLVAIFALAFVQQFFDDYDLLITVVGGLIVCIIGLSMALSDPFRKMRTDGKYSVSATDFVQAIIMGLSNPGAIFVIFALFAFFGLGDSPNDWRVAPVVLAVSAGSAVYWFFVSWALSKFRNKFKMSTIIWISRITGAVVVVIGLALFGQGLFRMIFHGEPLI